MTVTQDAKSRSAATYGPDWHSTGQVEGRLFVGVETSTHPSCRHNRIMLGMTPRNVMATLLLASTKMTTIKLRNKFCGFKMRENAR
jgi:hypothetical protein